MTTPTFIANEAKTFLEDFRPVGLQNMVAINMAEELKGITFDMPTEREDAIKWAKDNNEKGFNLYFTVNEVTKPVNTKPNKTHFEKAQYLHTDIDPDTSESYTVGRAALKERVAEGDFEDAAFVLDSGNGLGVFYKLPEPLEQAEAENLNRGLSRIMGGDKCHNIDRLMRLPGTINYSNKKKLASGYPEKTQAAIAMESDPELMATPALIELAHKALTEAPTPTATEVAFTPFDSDDMAALAAQLTTALVGSANLRDRWRGSRAGLTDTSRSSYDMSIVRALAAAKFTATEARAAMISAAAKDGVVLPFKHDHSAMAEKCDNERYFTRMWARTHANETPETETTGFSFATASTKIDMARLLGPQEYPPELVPGFFPREVCTLVGAGGASKTTLSMVIALRRAIGRPLWKGGDSDTPHGVLYLSGEDGDKVIYSRMQRIIKAEGLDKKEQELLAQNFHLVDATAHTIRFVESEYSGINDTRHVQEFIAAFSEKNIQMVYIDTASLFGAGEDGATNDAPVALIRACRKISHGIHDEGACVCVLHHTGQENFRNTVDDMYAGRGGSAGADNSRALHVLSHYSRPANGIGDGKYPLPTEIDRDHPGAVEAGRVFTLKIAKYSYGPCPQQPYWVVRGEGTDAFQFSVYEPLCPEVAEANKATKQAQLRAETEKKAQVLEEKKRLILLKAITAIEKENPEKGISRAAVLRDEEARDAWLALTGKTGFKNAPKDTITRMVVDGQLSVTGENTSSRIWLTKKGIEAHKCWLKNHGLAALAGGEKSAKPAKTED